MLKYREFLIFVLSYCRFAAYKALVISTIVDPELIFTAGRLAYKALVISTIVDYNLFSYHSRSYKALVISTIVDSKNQLIEVSRAYKALVISTIVDIVRKQTGSLLPIRL